MKNKWKGNEKSYKVRKGRQKNEKIEIRKRIKSEYEGITREKRLQSRREENTLRMRRECEAKAKRKQREL